MTMLRTLEIRIALPAAVKFSQSVGSLFHGLLMEHLDSAYAEFLHRQSLHPYSQYLYYDKARQGLYWRISSLDSAAAAEIIGVAQALPSELYLRQKAMTIKLEERCLIAATSYSDLAERYFLSTENFLDVEFNFLSGTSFKSGGSYALYPEPHLLFGSLLNKWNAFTASETIKEQDLAANLAEQVYTYAYKLRLAPFSLEGTRVPAFQGSYTLALKGNQMVRKIICLLAAYAFYSGIGIKTSLGMGGCVTRLIKGKEFAQ